MASSKRVTALSRERILRCALRIADEEDSIGAVSMRAIAAKLGVEAMSLYNHVAGKEELVAGMIDLVLSEIDVPMNASDWKVAMRRRAISAHEVLLRHPWAPALIESHGGLSETRQRYADSVLGVLRKAGFSIRQSYSAFLTLDSFVNGFVLQEVNWPHAPEDVPAAIAALRPQVSATQFPHLTEVMSFVARERAATSGGYEAEFSFGLELVLGALEQLLHATPGGTESLPRKLTS